MSGMSLSGVKMIVVLAVMAFSLCSAKFVGLSSLTNLAQISAQSVETVACQFCNELVQGMDEHGVKDKYNTSEKLSKGLQEICPQVPHGSPDEAFCKALKGNYRVFTDAYFQHREHPEIDPCKVAHVCSAKSVGFNKLGSLSKVFALSHETPACEDCEQFVRQIDEQGLKQEFNTSEKFAKGLQDVCKAQPEDQFCNALKGKYDVFAKAYFQHREHPEVDPCKVAGVCTAKSVGFNKLASLSKVFALNNEKSDCKNCEEFVGFLDGGELPPTLATPEKLAKGLKKLCKRDPPKDPICKALEGKFDSFAKAYFQHRNDDHQVDPCKVVQVC